MKNNILCCKSLLPLGEGKKRKCNSLIKNLDEGIWIWNWLLVIVWCLFLGNLSLVFAQESITRIIKSDTTEKIQTTFNNGLSIGYIKVESSEVGVVSWRPDLKFGVWGMGLDMNVTLNGTQPNGFENLILRYVEYDDGLKGMRYGVLESVTLGHGLLMKNYTTRTAGQVFLTNYQVGLKGYYRMGMYGVEGMKTWSNLYTARVTERVHPMLSLGQYIVSDVDGVRVTQTNGTVKTFPAVTGIGVDATVPFPLNFEGYSELAMISGKGKGFSTGISWGMDILIASASLLGEYRSIDANFVPGYFNAEYESNPVDLASYEANTQSKDGYLMELRMQALALSSLSLIYEAYRGSNSTVTGQLSARLSDQISVSGYYKQPNFTDFKSLTLEQGSVMGADIGYKVNPYTTMITHYKKAYNASLGRVEESQYYEVQLSF